MQASCPLTRRPPPHPRKTPTARQLFPWWKQPNRKPAIRNRQSRSGGGGKNRDGPSANRTQSHRENGVHQLLSDHGRFYPLWAEQRGDMRGARLGGRLARDLFAGNIECGSDSLRIAL